MPCCCCHDVATLVRPRGSCRWSTGHWSWRRAGGHHAGFCFTLHLHIDIAIMSAHVEHREAYFNEEYNDLEEEIARAEKMYSTDKPQRTRSRSPPGEYRHSRRRSDRDRSPSRERRDRNYRERSPANGHDSARYSSSHDNRAPPPRSYEDRSHNKEQMMQSVRDSSQQDRRVYVGNLSYDVKWHHLKDFMRKGTPTQDNNKVIQHTDASHSWRRSLRRRTTSSEWNVKG